MDVWKTDGHDQGWPCYRLLNKEYNDTPGHPELLNLVICRQNNNNAHDDDDNNNKKKINKI